jgi:hypothetical protein
MSYSPLAKIHIRTFLDVLESQRTFLGIGKADPWGPVDEFVGEYSNDELNNDFRDLFFLKQLHQFAMPVVRRIDWEERVFDHYSSDSDMEGKDFYCVTPTRNIYKCLDNNKGAISTIMPEFVIPGAVTLADGYKWQYMATIPEDAFLKFSTPDWIPVKILFGNEVGYELQWAAQVAAVPGTLDRVDIIQKGESYSESAFIEIKGDGEDAEVDFVRNPLTGEIESVTVINKGRDYTWIEIQVIDPAPIPGTGCFLKASISPFFGHGFDIIQELYCSTVAIVAEIQTDEAGMLPNETIFRKTVIIPSPRDLDAEEIVAERFLAASTIQITNSTGTFSVGDHITSTNGEGVVVNVSSDILHVSSIKGYFEVSDIITNGTSEAEISDFTLNGVRFNNQLLVRRYHNPIQKDETESKRIYMLSRF